MPETTDQQAQRPTILVVDDTPQNLSLMSDLLEDQYTVKLATSGARALKIATTAPHPDLILLDIVMPEMDGYAVCRELKADPACKDIPVIFVTAMTEIENEETGLALGAVDYITKPISPSIVLARIRNQIALKAAADELRMQNQLLDKARAQTQELLQNILPVEIAAELTATGKVRPVRHDEVSILFTDFSGFTQTSATMPASRMVAELNDIFVAFDDICDAEGLEKIKTIGDAFMAAAGLPKFCDDHAQRCARAGLRMTEYLGRRNRDAAFKWDLRVGIHSGPVVSGVVGKRKYTFDIWGDTVNIAARMESAGEIGRVNISAYTYDLIRADFSCAYRGKIDAKGKGQVDMYFVDGAVLSSH
ncbi:MAG: adenylate/guanylate cyclase domain-containing protein [Rugosibacter sp.]